MTDSTKTALITGGSSGIGLELARLFARDGYRLLLVSKPEEELRAAGQTLRKTFPEVKLFTRQEDLSLPGAAEKVHRWTRENQWAVDVLVNNAGFGTYGFINDIDIDRELTMIRLHVQTLYHLTRLFLNDMVDRNSGRIVNLSSISAFQANPSLATYGATKSFVLQFSRAINYELREKGLDIRVLAVCPTPVRSTGFQADAGMEHTNTFDNWMTVPPELVARDAYRAMQEGPDLVIPGRFYQWLHGLIRHLPNRTLMRMARSSLKSNRS